MKRRFDNFFATPGTCRICLITVLLLWGDCLFARLPAPSTATETESGFITTSDGTRLFYTKVGNGTEAVTIVPGRLFLFRDFQRLATQGRTFIFYDMRNRGKSSPVTDVSHISLQYDADDLETVRAHFRVDKPGLIGFSYLGKIVILYATQHLDHVQRIVQLGPVSRKFGTKYPKALTAGDEDRVPDPAEERKLDNLEKSGFSKDHPKEFCEMEWKLEQQRMVGDADHASRIPSPCEMKNEWPARLAQHFKSLLASDQALDITNESIARVRVPVLTIHGTRDRNAPYGGGREWDTLLPNARLITIEGAAHMSWVDFPEVVLPSIDQFLNGHWPEAAERVESLESAAEKQNDSLAPSDECHDLSSADVVAVRQTNAAYPAAWMANDQAAVMRLFTSDAVLIPHHGDSPVVGEAAIRRHFWPPNSPYFHLDDFRMEPAEISGCAGFSYAHGRFEMEYTTDVDNVRRTYANAGNYLMILRKHGDQWLISRYIWDDPAPRIVTPSVQR